MKTNLSPIAITAIVILLLPWLLASGQEKISESVEVVNVEIVARVFANGRSLGGLKKEDFVLYENGVKTDINGFREVRQRMKAIPPPQPESESEAPALRPGRLFILYFWLFEPQVQWAEALDHFFSQVWRPGDRVILAYGDEKFDFQDSPGRDAAMSSFTKRFNEHLIGQRHRRERMIAELELTGQDFTDRLKQVQLKEAASGHLAACFMDLRARYLSYLTEFRWQYLNANEAKLASFVESLRGIDAEKWVLVFSQREAPPMYRPDGKLAETAGKFGLAGEMGELFTEAERRFRTPRDLPSYIARFRSGVISARATFHLLLLDSKEKNNLNSEYVTRLEGTSNWEALCRDMSRDSGGTVVDSGDLRQAMEQVAEKEDIHYVMTFAPAEGGDAGRRLKLEVNQPGMRVVFADRIKVRETFPLSIGAVRFREPVLELDLAGYQLLYANERLAGRVALEILARGPGDGVMEWNRELDLTGERVTVSLRLGLPAPGRYNLNVGLTDLNSGRRARAEEEIEVSAGAPATVAATARGRAPAHSASGLRLLDALEKAGHYCEKLKRSAFRFVCDEQVQEALLVRDPMRRGLDRQINRWVYDYQIVGREQTLHEKRTLLRENARTTREEDAAPKTRVVSLYGFFMPVTFLARENRDKFDYRLSGDEKIGKRRCLVVEATPRQGDPDVQGATRLWIDRWDGSVLKIELATPAIRGIEALRDTARRMGARLEVRDLHWYGVEKGGVRFPSATLFRELYKFDKSPAFRDTYRWTREGDVYRVPGSRPPVITREYHELELSRIDIEYKNYRFFEVSTELEIRE